MTKRWLGALFALLMMGPTWADATPLLAERSPLRPGPWWDSNFAGSGFDVHVAGDAVFVTWFTYRDDGSPTWYTAQGRFDAEGELTADWLQHRWQGEDYAGHAAAGTARFVRRHAEHVELHWRLLDAEGTWSLRPLPLAAAVPERDPSGAFYDPARPGYGLSVAAQGTLQALAYYHYDDAGEPTWLLGVADADADAVEMRRFRGACPGCTPAVASSEAWLRAAIAFDDDRALALTLEAPPGRLPAAFARSPQPLVQLSTPASLRAADRQLARFDDAAALESTLKGALLEGSRDYYPGSTCPVCSPPVLSAAPPPAVASTTNLVEAGVDEADEIKSDGRFVYLFAADEFQRRLPRLRIAEIAGDGPTFELHPEVELPYSGDDSVAHVHRLFLHEDRLVTLIANRPNYYPVGGPVPALWPGPQPWRSGFIELGILDRSDPAQPATQWRARVDGYLVGARRIGDQLYLVHRSSEFPQDLQLAATSDEAQQANRELLDGLELADLLPKIAVGDGEPEPLLRPQDVLLPPVGARPAMPEFAIVTRIDLSDPSQRQSLAILGGVESLYVAPQALYLATTRFQPRFDPVRGDVWDGYSATEIHKIALDDDGMRAEATGSVEGVIGRDPERAPFRFSEHDGRLRLFTVGDFGGFGRNRLHVLEPSGIVPGLLRTVAQLPSAAEPTPIGKPDEDLYGTRFVGDRVYAVTFLNVDPLYVIDLADPAAPKILGELELPGFSEYLHPLADDLLLGIGKDASPAEGWGDGRFAWFQGLQLVLFDVADPLAPRVLDRVLLGERGSDSALLRDHHGFSALALAEDRFRFTLPARLHGQRQPTSSGTGSDFVPWTESGLFAFDVVGTGAAARFEALPPLVTAARPAAEPSPDDAQRQARSVLLESGVIYAEGGRLWSQRWGGGGRNGPR